MKKLFRHSLFLFMAGALLTTACKDHEHPEPDHEHSLITTVTLRLVPNNSTSAPTVTATWKDLDGVGGDPAVIDNINLRANTTYTGTLTLASEAVHGNHVDTHDLTAEIKEEGDVHELFYTVTPQNLMDVQKTDRDSQNRPIGLATTVTTTATAGTGTLGIILKHQVGTKSTPSNPTAGETDVDISFPVAVQN